MSTVNKTSDDGTIVTLEASLRDRGAIPYAFLGIIIFLAALCFFLTSNPGLGAFALLVGALLLFTWVTTAETVAFTPTQIIVVNWNGCVKRQWEPVDVSSVKTCSGEIVWGGVRMKDRGTYWHRLTSFDPKLYPLYGNPYGILNYRAEFSFEMKDGDTRQISLRNIGLFKSCREEIIRRYTFFSWDESYSVGA